MHKLQAERQRIEKNNLYTFLRLEYSWPPGLL